jgi:hypothetical protein
MALVGAGMNVGLDDVLAVATEFVDGGGLVE